MNRLNKNVDREVDKARSEPPDFEREVGKRTSGIGVNVMMRKNGGHKRGED